MTFNFQDLEESIRGFKLSSSSLKPSSFSIWLWGSDTANSFYNSAKIVSSESSVSNIIKPKTNIVCNNSYYVSKEIDTKALDGYNEGKVEIKTHGELARNYKLSVGCYDKSVGSWANIDKKDIQEFSISSEAGDSVIVKNLDGLRQSKYYRFRIDSVQPTEIYVDEYLVQEVRLLLSGEYEYNSEPIRVGNKNIKDWGIFEEEGRYKGKDSEPKFYMRSGETATEIGSKEWVRLNRDEDVKGLDLNDWVEFRADFKGNDESRVEGLGIKYKTSEKYAKPCAIAYKTKYILSMSDGTGADNNIEYIYDRKGYWTIKDGEGNNCYFKTTGMLFAGDNKEGKIRQKDSEERLNEGKEFESYFETKKFSMIGYENFFRSIRAQYKSEEDVRIWYSTDDEEYKEIAFEGDGKLKEEKLGFPERVWGQTMKLKVSWKANGKTEIHNIAIEYDRLRRLREGERNGKRRKQ
jgi:hypothetical protein